VAGKNLHLLKKKGACVMRKHRTSYMEGLFYTTGNYHQRTLGDIFGFSRQYTDTISQEMLDDERINNLHRKEEQDSIDKQKNESGHKQIDKSEDE
jgi:hypothetical protein